MTRAILRYIWLAVLLVPAYALASSSEPSYFVKTYDVLIQRSVHRWWGIEGPDWHWWKAQLFQESRLDPNVISWVGAKGIAQFMDFTWISVERQLGVSGANPREARYAIDAGAYYMRSLRDQWTANRSLMEKHKLAQASYNTGEGNVLRAQAACDGARLWDDIKKCLPQVTGRDAQQTIEYVRNIQRWRSLMGA